MLIVFYHGIHNTEQFSGRCSECDHRLISLTENDYDYPFRWRAIKGIFTRKYRENGGVLLSKNKSRKKRRESTVWQRRYWEHRIRDEGDLITHFDYIHFNPVKHGLVENVRDWPWCSFHRYVNNGHYEPAWGSIDDVPVLDNRDFGE